MDISLQEQVWNRAQGRCEYCHFPSQLTRVAFQLDHIIAEKHGGPTTFENLALSCFFCTATKVQT
jgi:5-methylcytosine-specific restriction endonuclease McrA